MVVRPAVVRSCFVVRSLRTMETAIIGSDIATHPAVPRGDAGPAGCARGRRRRRGGRRCRTRWRRRRRSHGCARRSSRVVELAHRAGHAFDATRFDDVLAREFGQTRRERHLTPQRRGPIRSATTEPPESSLARHAQFIQRRRRRFCFDATSLALSSAPSVAPPAAPFFTPAPPGRNRSSTVSCSSTTHTTATNSVRPTKRISAR